MASSVLSLQSLPDICLHGILYYTDEPAAFYSLALTCRKFHQITKYCWSVLHPNILRTKAEYYIKRCIADMAINGNYFEYENLESFLRETRLLIEDSQLLSYSKVIDVWSTNGPVAATLFTWLRKYGTSLKPDDTLPFWFLVDNRASFAQHRYLTFSLPSCKKEIAFKTEYIYRHNPSKTERTPENLSIQVTCGDLTRNFEWPSSICFDPEEYRPDKKVRILERVMKTVIDLLQGELGKTVPPITGRFLIWLCFIFPEVHDSTDLVAENKLKFKDETQNAKPTLAAVQAARDEFHKWFQQIQSRFQALACEWKTGEKPEPLQSQDSCLPLEVKQNRGQDVAAIYVDAGDSKHLENAEGRPGTSQGSLGVTQEIWRKAFPTKRRRRVEHADEIADTIYLIMLRSEAATLTRIEECARRFYRVCARRFYRVAKSYELNELDKHILLEFILRTRIEASSYTPATITSGSVKSTTVHFRCVGGGDLKVIGSIHGDGESYPATTWNKIKLEFTLPGGEVVNVEALNTEIAFENLHPVTKLLQECADQRAQGEIPRTVDDFLTTAFFLEALEFSDATIPFMRNPHSQSYDGDDDYDFADFSDPESYDEPDYGYNCYNYQREGWSS